MSDTNLNIQTWINTRYSTKVFDSTKTITQAEKESIIKILQMSPSSVNSQPWHFILADNQSGKEKIAKSTAGIYSFNTGKIMDAGLVIAFCAKTNIDEKYLEKLTDQEAKDKRFSSVEAQNEQHAKRKMFTDMHKITIKDLPEWLCSQVYLNLGFLLFGVAALGLDAVPIEGFDPDSLDEEFALPEKGLSSKAIVAIGHHAENDFNYNVPKSRLPIEDIMTIL